MTLPKVKHPTYPVELPSTGKTIHYRPFTVKEENILLLAKQENNEQGMINSVKQIITNCVVDDIDVDSLTSFDVELLFVKIRSKSVGETVDLKILCDHCEEQTYIPVQINLEDVQVVFDENHKKKFMLDDTVGIQMQYPTIHITQELLKKGLSENTDDPKDAYRSIISCMDMIFDSDDVYPISQIDEDEALSWLEDLTNEQRNMIIDFFNTMPYVKVDVKAHCDKCGNVTEHEIKGIKNFFM